MNTQKLTGSMFSVAALTVVAAGASFAGNLAPGTTITPVLVTTESGVLFTSEIVPFQSTQIVGGSPSYTGSLYSAVYKEAGGTLDFIFQVKNDPTTRTDGLTNDNLSRVAGGIFQGYDVSAFYSTQMGLGGLGDGTQAPSSAFMTNTTGVGFDFRNGNNAALAPGTTSYVLVVKTNATNFVNSKEGVSDNTTVNVASYSPAAAVPEPASVIPFALGGLGLLGLIARKTRRTNGAAA